MPSNPIPHKEPAFVPHAHFLPPEPSIRGKNKGKVQFLSLGNEKTANLKYTILKKDPSNSPPKLNFFDKLGNRYVILKVKNENNEEVYIKVGRGEFRTMLGMDKSLFSTHLNEGYANNALLSKIQAAHINAIKPEGEKETEDNNIERLVDLGNYYLNDKNYDYAFKCFQQASEIQLKKPVSKSQITLQAEAQLQLGRCYENGWGTQVSKDSAKNCYLIAASNNNLEAAYNLARCYEFGIGCEISHPKARNYYELYYDKNNSTNKLNDLARIYKKMAYDPGLHARTSLYFKTKSIEYYAITAEQGNIEAQVALMYFGKDKHPLALYHLGRLYEKGVKGIPSNPKRAFNLYKKAAVQGNEDAQYHLARCYEKGIGTNIDKNKADEWFNKVVPKLEPE